MTKVKQGTQDPSPINKPLVGLFVTCLVDLFRPSVGLSSVKLLEDAGADVEVPSSQTCCGQPAYNGGDKKSARDIARQVITSFAPYDYVVAPSASCAAMIKKHYPLLFDGDKDGLAQAQALAEKTYELTAFLVDICALEKLESSYEGRVCYHPSCSALRELQIKEQPRRLLSYVKGLTVKEIKEGDVCCGFGGAFSVKYPDLSNAMVAQKVQNISATGTPLVISVDLGCLLNIAGKLSREGRPIHARHIAEILAGMTEAPAIGRPQS